MSTDHLASKNRLSDRGLKKLDCLFFNTDKKIKAVNRNESSIEKTVLAKLVSAGWVRYFDSVARATYGHRLVYIGASGQLPCMIA